MAALFMDRYSPLRTRTIALVGLMGVGKTSVGRRLATVLELPFRDADVEVEAAAGRSIPEIFADLGEPAFREGERRVISRLLDEPPHILATGGGAFVSDETRALIKANAVSVWLKADLDVLARRLARKDNRPLLAGRDPKEVLQQQAEARYRYYGEADVTVETSDAAHQVSVDQVIEAVSAYIESQPK
ncbi:shikimate kinase [Phenylobacterium sp.]|uniref:shikimate kinase n=1 Tax=Phenylobacterium sp. TaxID=1871053 RepID=UPI0027347FB0|nr:shikimate kinase [Phenylobacterium sp.]MDP3659186.1 shikimate kinase [Phenylobacterium sp.]